MAILKQDNEQDKSSGHRPRGRPVSLTKRRAILEATIVEFSKNSYDNTSMDTVSAAANVSKRTLYNHFSSKEDLFRSLAEELCKRISVSSHLEYQPDIPLREQLSTYAHGMAKLIQDHKSLALLRAILAEHIRSPDLLVSVMEHFWEEEYGFVNWVSAACRDGKLRTQSVKRTSHQFAGLIKGIAVWPIVFRQHDRCGAEEIESGIEEAIEMFITYYGV